MSAIKLSTPSSGSISLSPADTASNLTLTVPAQSGSVVTANSSGNVGIGTNSPNNVITTYSGSGVSNYIQFTNATTGTSSTDGCLIGVAADDTALRLRVLEAAPMIFTTSDTERMRVTSGGDVCIGSTAFTWVPTQTGYQFKTPSTPWFVITGNNATADNSFGPSVYNLNATYNGTRFFVRVDGGVANYSANNQNLSDERVKNNIELSGGYLDKICAIPVKLFNYKDEPEGTQKSLGVIAQDVEAVAPELINATDGFGVEDVGDEPLKTVYQTDLQYALMKCIQEQQAIITDLKARIEVLETK